MIHEKLDQVMKWYEAISETQGFTKQFLKQNRDKVGKNSGFFGLTGEELTEELSKVKSHLDELAIVALFSRLKQLF